jgi:hypothetical protein
VLPVRNVCGFRASAELYNWGAPSPPGMRAQTICARVPKTTFQGYPTAEDLMNAKRSAFIVAASVVGMPCGKPL